MNLRHRMARAETKTKAPTATGANWSSEGPHQVLSTPDLTAPRSRCQGSSSRFACAENQTAYRSRGWAP